MVGFRRDMVIMPIAAMIQTKKEKRCPRSRNGAATLNPDLD